MSVVTDRNLRLGALVWSTPGVWTLPALAGGGLVHGVGDRSLTAEALVERLGLPAAAVLRLEQVHGSAIAEVARRPASGAATLPGADGAITDVPGMALTVRTADCAPLGFSDPAHRAIGVAHIGWRGLQAGLPQRMVEAMQRRWGTDTADLRVAVGPAIGACCYVVGPEFEPRFPAWVRRVEGRRVLDLRAGIMTQLQQAGVRAASIADSGVCTACHPRQFHSYRRDGAAAGRQHFALALLPDPS